ncbi:hypothetical protein BDW74DRAFT_188270 [Aspergillus multicolor]|uniref:flavin-containing monooxygenase n=1 Tax=Aspergillus multicolor TaxID=41759 RepID=UPI003CCD9844
MADNPLDLLIVGAGLHGLIMAKTYLEANPSAKLLLIDESSSIGGTWARERLYPGLKTNNVFGSYELSDFPMIPEKYGVEGKGHIPGEVVHKYFCDVAEHFGLVERVRLRTRVVDAEQNEKRVWMVRIKDVESDLGRVEMIYAEELVIATGLTSKPYIPHLPGSDTFTGLILHSKQLREQAQALSDCKRVVVVGGNKSAWDVCYTAAKAGSQVDMVIRPSGGGPSYLWPRQFSFGPFNISLAKLSLMRLFTPFDPAPLIPSPSEPLSWVKRVLHHSNLGQWITRRFWTYLDRIIRRLNGYSTHPELKKLEPWTTPFWMGNSLSIHNYETSWFDLVREGRIRVHIADVEELSEGRVYLRDANGEEERLNADALVLCTGWRCDIPVQLEAERQSAHAYAKQQKNRKEALEAVYESAPYLKTLARRTPNAPAYQGQTVSREKEGSPSFPLLYRDILPVQQCFIKRKNLAFIGMSVSIHAVLVAQAQALWITALFVDKIPSLHFGHENEDIRNSNLDMYKAIQNRAILDRAYGEVRRPRETGGLAGHHQDLVFDNLPYVDGLLADLGVETRRKGRGVRGWWRELTEAYCPADYRGMVGEWMALQGVDEGRTPVFLQKKQLYLPLETLYHVL